jgi:hypothetical protein
VKPEKGAGRALEQHQRNARESVETLCSILQLGPRQLLELCAKHPVVAWC